MASGAIGSADPADTSMQATPVSRRAGTEVRAGGSPSAKRATRKEVVQQVGAATPTLSHDPLAQEVHRMHIQGEKDNTFFENSHDQINDHADCLQLIRTHLKALHGS